MQTEGGEEVVVSLDARKIERLAKLCEFEASGFDVNNGPSRDQLADALRAALEAGSQEAASHIGDEDRERIHHIANAVEGTEAMGVFSKAEAGFLRRIADAAQSPASSTSSGPQYPPAPRLVESLRWALGFIDGLKKFDPNEKPYNGGEEEHDWMEWAGAHDWLKDAELAGTPSVSLEGEQREYRVNAHDGIYGPFPDRQAALWELGEHQADWDDNGGPRPPELESRAVGPWVSGAWACDACRDTEERSAAQCHGCKRDFEAEGHDTIPIDWGSQIVGGKHVLTCPDCKAPEGEPDWQYEHHMEQCAHGGTLHRIDRLTGALREINGHIGAYPDTPTEKCIREVVVRELERGDADEAARIRSERKADCKPPSEGEEGEEDWHIVARRERGIVRELRGTVAAADELIEELREERDSRLTKESVAQWLRSGEARDAVQLALDHAEATGTKFTYNSGRARVVLRALAAAFGEE